MSRGSISLVLKSRWTSFLCSLGLSLAIWTCGIPVAQAQKSAGTDAVPADLRAIGGHWFMRDGKTPTYLYRDADRFVDLFSYHTADANKDGVPDVRISHGDGFLLVQSQGFPNHPTAMFPNSGNPNTIRVQNFRFRFPLVPKLARTVTAVPGGPIGMALNGVVFFNPFERGGMNAVEGYSEVWLDSCCGHPEQRGVYHYHKYPSCVKSPFKDDGQRHSPIIGFAFDGFPVYGPYESAKTMAKDLKGDRILDECNGHADPERGYHYHVTPGRFPYLIGGYAGTPEPSNSPPLRHAVTGAIQNNASGRSRLGDAIASVEPASAKAGRKQALRITVNPDRTRGGLPQGAPDWVQIGPFEATKISRQGNVVTVEISIPEDAPVGVTMDCHLEFKSSQAREGIAVIKRNDVFRIEP